MDKQLRAQFVQSVGQSLEPLLLTWFNFDTSMDN